MIPASFSPDPLPFDRQRLLAEMAQALPPVVPVAGAVISATVELPDLPINSSPLHMPDVWSWTRPSEGLTLIGVGTALSREVAGPEALAAAVAGLDWRHLGGDGQPVAFLGHGFGGDDPTGLPGGLLRVPRLLLRSRKGRCQMVFSHAGDGDPDAVRQSWLDGADRLLLALQTPVPTLSENSTALLRPAAFSISAPTCSSVTVKTALIRRLSRMYGAIASPWPVPVRSPRR